MTPLPSPVLQQALPALPGKNCSPLQGLILEYVQVDDLQSLIIIE